MKKYFVCSDIHGFFTEWMISLGEAGFEVTNKDHILIVLGDIFDRGREPRKIYEFLKSLPDNRLVLIRGNHEYLLLDLVKRKFYFEYDETNGTYQTLVDLYEDPHDVQKRFILDNSEKYNRDELYTISFAVYQEAVKKLYTNDTIKEVVRWIKSKKWKNFYELGKYIFVHSFIPLRGIRNPYYENTGEYFEDWRENTDQKAWEDATWGCPYKLYLNGCFDEEIKKGKILVCGHWHTSSFFNEMLYRDDKSKQIDIRKENPIFQSDLYPGIIGIDTCTVLTKKVNILVIDDNQL